MGSRWVERFWEQVQVGDPAACWLWTGALDRQGYGRAFQARRGRFAHRLAYELVIGPIPEGMVIDHECHNTGLCVGGYSCPHRRCCNPGHMVPKTIAANVEASPVASAVLNRAKTHCDYGHSLDDAYVSKEGWRYCRACKLDRSRRRYLRRKAWPSP